MKSERRISFSLSSLLLIVASVFLLVLLWQLRGLIVLLMISVVLAASIVPLVNWAEKKQVPRWLAVVIVYLTLIAGLMGFGLVIGPAVVDQITLLVRQSPVFAEQIIRIATDLAGRLGSETSTFIEQLIDPQSLTDRKSVV